MATVVRAVLGLARELGLTTVAEGVEDARTARRLAEFGCDVVQGFHFSPPVAAEQLLRLLTQTVGTNAATAQPISGPPAAI